MKKNTVVLDFIRFTIPNKIVFGRTAISKMMAIQLFMNPDVMYPALTESVNKLETLYMSSRSGDHQQVALMHQAEVEFDELFRKLGNYVDRMADGDEAVILSAGFHLAKQPSPSEKSEFSVEAGDVPGTMVLKRKALAGASAYVWQYYVGTAAPAEGDWLFASSTTQTSYVMKGLTPGTKVWFRVAGVTKDGLQPFTDAIMKVVP